jgi:hypothetical protein
VAKLHDAVDTDDASLKELSPDHLICAGDHDFRETGRHRVGE